MRAPYPHRRRPAIALTGLATLALFITLLAGASFARDPTTTLRAEHLSARLQPQGELPNLPTWRPNAIFNDGAEATTFTIFRDDVAVEETLWITSEGVLVPDGDQPLGAESIRQDLVRLYDDGTHGDEVAQDSRYTRSGITASGPLSHDDGTHQALTVELVFVANDSHGSIQYAHATLPNSPLGVVDLAQRGAVPAFQLSATLSATSHALFLADDGTYFPTYPNVDEDLVVDAFVRCVACELLIDQFGDAFDLISLQVGERLPSHGALDFVAFSQGVVNDVGGIGRPLFNNNLDNPVTRSAGRLRAIIWENEIDAQALTHEVIHTWGVDIGLDAGFNDGTSHYGPYNTLNGVIDQELVDADGVPIFRDDSEILTDLVANGDGTFRVVARPGEYNATLTPLSLYLAGFIPSAQVPGWEVLSKPNFSDLERVTAASVTRHTVADVIADYGLRSPAAGLAPTDFRLGVVVFKDRPFSEAEYAFATLALRYFESNKLYDGSGAPPWRSATLGLSTITVALPAFGGVPIDFSSNPPDGSATPADDSATLPPLLTSRSVSISPGWNLIGWTGRKIDTTLALGAIGDIVRNIFVWDPLLRTFDSYNPLAPSFLNDLDFLISGEGLWLFSTANTVTTWDIPVSADALSGPAVQLAEGANLVAWLGADDTSIANAVAGLGDAFLSLQTWDAPSERFQIYAGGVPALLNTLSTLHFGDALWISVTRAVDWQQQASAG